MRQPLLSRLKNSRENRISVKNGKEDESPPSSFTNQSRAQIIRFPVITQQHPQPELLLLPVLHPSKQLRQLPELLQLHLPR